MSAVPTLTTLGPSIWIRGVLRGREDLVLYGCIEGHIDLQGKLHIAEKGLVRASVRARDVVVAGDVWGNIEAAESIEILDSGRVFGDIFAPKMTIASGAILHGLIHGEQRMMVLQEGGEPSLALAEAAQALEADAVAHLPSLADSPTETAEATDVHDAEAEMPHAEPCEGDRMPLAAAEQATNPPRDLDGTPWVERPRMRPISLLPPKARKLPKKKRMGILVKRRGDD